MNNEKEIQINSERVEEVVSDIKKIWIDDGYREEYLEYKSPFEMLKQASISEEQEVIQAIEQFQNTILESPVGQRYVVDLYKNNPYMADEIISRNTQQERGKFIRELMIKSMKLGDEKKSIIINYFINFGYKDLKYWSEEEGNNILFANSKDFGEDCLDIIESNHDVSRMENPKVWEQKEPLMEKLKESIQIAKLPGFVAGKYSEFREAFVKSVSDPNIFDRFDKTLGRGRSNPYVGILEKIGSYAKDDDSIHQGVAKEFLSNILFDPDLFVVVENLRRIEEKEKGKLLGGMKVGISFEEIFDMSISNPKYRGINWFRDSGKDTLESIFREAPQIYMMILDSYLERYVKDENLSKRERLELREILKILFSKDMKRKTSLAYKSTTEDLEKLKENKLETFMFKFLSSYTEKLLKENKEFFEDTKGWMMFWKDRRRVGYLSKLFEIDERLFDLIIDSLMDASNNTKERNYFDNIRMINRLSKKLTEEYSGGNAIEGRPLGDIRDETEYRIIEDAKKLCEIPGVRLTINGGKDIETLNKLLKAYLDGYRNLVSPTREFGDIDIQIDSDGMYLNIPSDETLLFAIKSLGFDNFVKEGKVYITASREELEKRIAGILVSPTLYEWREDDKENTQGNNKIRSLFLVPNNIEIIYDKSGGNLINLDNAQEKYFIQNYLQWYIDSRYLMGDVSSFNTIISTWLNDKYELRKDIYNKKDDIKDGFKDIWNELIGAMRLVYKNERFKRDNIFEKLLSATNIEELLPLIKKDPVRISLLGSSVLKSILLSAYESKIERSIQKVVSSAGKQFEGTLLSSTITSDRLDRIKTGLKKLGFQESDEGLQMFRTIWRSLWQLRGKRGSNQTIKITASGIRISNPSHTMYSAKTIKERNSQGEMEDRLVRMFEGGGDGVDIGWEQIRQVAEVKYDNVPLVDIVISLLTNLSSVLAKKERYDIVEEIEEKGPANIIAKLPGREQPLFEIFAVENPREVWALIKGMAEIMAEEEGPETIKDLLQVLNEN